MKADSSRHRYVLVVMTMICAASASAIPAAELRPGVEYGGGDRVEDPESGASLAIPPGWVGRLGDDQETFVLRSAATAAEVWISSDEMTLEEAHATMSSPISLQGIVLTPSAAPAVSANTVSGSYSVRGASDPLAAEIRTVVSAAGSGVVVLGISQPADRESIREVVAEVAASVDFGPAAISGGSPSGSGQVGNPWRDHLAGQKLQSFSSGSSYSESSAIWLCANGVFYRGVQAGGHGGGASGAVQGNSGGRWSATGDDERGNLVLEFADGRRWTYALTYSENSDGSLRLFLDGDRWFREPVDCR